MDLEQGRDPAFDYLESRDSELSRLPDVDRAEIDRLLDDTAGRPVVGINIRPIRPEWTVSADESNQVEYTRCAEARFEQQLADGLRRFHQACPTPPCFVFFPMNAIQFGMSDLRSAYQIRRLVRGDVDFRVWEADASLDGVLALVRRLDIVISMRFHATIFALSLQKRVIGIDYRVGKRDKVAALLTDCGQSTNCTRIDTMTSDWLAARLTSLAADHVLADVDV
jgi:polysaccharide pyruvyl transferase WcaK-like protein